MKTNEITSQIINAAITVHKELGPGLLESVYHSCMVLELNRIGLSVEKDGITRIANNLRR